MATTASKKPALCAADAHEIAEVQHMPSQRHRLVSGNSHEERNEQGFYPLRAPFLHYLKDSLATT